MKRKILFIVFAVSSLFCYSIEKNDYEKFLFENGIIHNSTEIKEVYKLNDDYNLGFIIQNNQKPIIFITIW